MQPSDSTLLSSFYGNETMRERIAKTPPLGSGRKGKKVALGMGGEEEGVGQQEWWGGQERRKCSMGQWLKAKWTNFV